MWSVELLYAIIGSSGCLKGKGIRVEGFRRISDYKLEKISGPLCEKDLEQKFPEFASTAGSVSPMKSTEMQVLRPHLRPNESEMMGMGPPGTCLLRSPPGEEYKRLGRSSIRKGCCSLNHNLKKEGTLRD